MYIELTPAEQLLWQRMKEAIERWHDMEMSDTAAFAWMLMQTTADAHKPTSSNKP